MKQEIINIIKLAEDLLKLNKRGIWFKGIEKEKQIHLFYKTALEELISKKENENTVNVNINDSSANNNAGKSFKT